MAQAGGDDQFREDLRQQIAVWTTRTADADFAGTIDPDYLVLYRLLAGQVDHKTILEKGKAPANLTEDGHEVALRKVPPA